MHQKKYSSVVSCTSDSSEEQLLSTALLSPGGELSILLLNLEEISSTVNLEIDSSEEKEMYVYQATKENVRQPGFELNAIETFNTTHGKKLVLPAKSITTISSYALKNDDKGIILK